MISFFFCLLGLKSQLLLYMLDRRSSTALLPLRAATISAEKIQPEKKGEGSTAAAPAHSAHSWLGAALAWLCLEQSSPFRAPSILLCRVFTIQLPPSSLPPHSSPSPPSHAARSLFCTLPQGILCHLLVEMHAHCHSSTHRPHSHPAIRPSRSIRLPLHARTSSHRHLNAPLHSSPPPALVPPSRTLAIPTKRLNSPSK
jgi:hypothetical protein